MPSFNHSSALFLIMEEILSSYGYVGPKVLTELEMKAYEMNYVIHDPIVTIFCEIEDLRDLTVAAQKLYTAYQLISFAIKIIWKPTDFEDAFRRWDIKILIDKTWENLKTRFKEEHKVLRKLREKTRR